MAKVYSAGTVIVFDLADSPPWWLSDKAYAEIVCARGDFYLSLGLIRLRPLGDDDQ